LTAATVWLCCGVLQEEMRQLHRLGEIGGELLFMDSMLHMHPPELEAVLTGILQRRAAEEGCLVLVYGDCSARMLDLVRRFRVGRVDAINCAQLLLGRERYRRLMREEAFLVLPEWAGRWEQVMKSELGLNRSVARELMGENRGVLVYLDTGLLPVPQLQLEEFSSYTGLPFRVEEVALEQLLAGVRSAELQAMTARPGTESR